MGQLPVLQKQMRLIFSICMCLSIAASFPLCGLSQGANDDIETDALRQDEIEPLKGLSAFQPGSKSYRAAKLLRQFRQSQMTAGDSLQFFKDMAANGLKMTDIITAKTLIENAAIGNQALVNDFLGEKFSEGSSQVEMAILVYRRNLTKELIQLVANEFAGHAGKNAVYLAEIGKWVSQQDRSLTFSGDIDFSFVSLDENLTYAMKQRFDQLVMERTGLTAVQFDSVCTAHGKATPDVYIGEHGRMYGDEAMKGGTLKEIDLVSGTISDTQVPGRDVITDMVLEREVTLKSAGEIVPPKHSKEPGLSMEMVRHFNHDIVGPACFDPIDSIIKSAKYVDRSNEAIKGSDIALSNPKLAKFAADITLAAKTSDFKKLAALLKDQFGNSLDYKLSPSGGKPQAQIELNAEVVQSFFQTCNIAMWNNVAGGFSTRLRELDQSIKDLDESKDPEAQKELKQEEMRADMIALKDMIDSEMLVLADNHQVVPENIKRMQIELDGKIDAFLKRKRLRAITEDELKQKKFIEDNLRSKTKGGKMLALATLARQASEGFDSFNRLLDICDETLLGELRGASPTFQKLTASTGNARTASTQTRLEKIAEVAANAKACIGSANSFFNEEMNATASRSVALNIMTKTNLLLEIKAYYESYNEGGFKALATEYFKRRVPAGAVIDAYYQENYLRTGIETVYSIFPPLAIPEGLYGMVESVAGYGVQKWRSADYKAMVDALYKDAEFEGTKLIAINYNCTGKGKAIRLLRDEAKELPSLCPQVWQTIAPQIKAYPVLGVFEEMLANPAVSSGRDDIFPYSYKGLNRYGNSLQETYHQQADKVVTDYFEGVVQELEKRKMADSGELYKKILEIGKEIGCSRPIAEPGELTRAQMESIIENYAAWKKDSVYIRSIKEQSGATFITVPTPTCSAISISECADNAKRMVAKINAAIARAKSDVTQIAGDDAQNDTIMKPVIYCALGAALSPTEESPGWQKRYQDELDKLRRKGTKARILVPEVCSAGSPINLQVEYDRPNPDRQTRWTFTEAAATTTFSTTSVDSASFKPEQPGRYVVRLGYKENSAWTTELDTYATINVVEATALKIELTAPTTNVQAGEALPMEVTVTATRPDDPIVKYTWSENGKTTSVTRSGNYTFEANNGRPKTTVTVVAESQSGQKAAASIEISVEAKRAQGLRVFIAPAGGEIISENDTVELAPSVILGTTSNTAGYKMAYQWYVNGQVVSQEKQFAFRARPYSGKTVKITLYVQQVSGSNQNLLAEGQAEKFISVKPEGSISVVLGPVPSTIEEGNDLEVSVVLPEESSDLTYAWYEGDARSWSDNSYGKARSHKKAARFVGEELRLKVVVRDSKGRTATAATELVKVVPPGTKAKTKNKTGTETQETGSTATGSPPNAEPGSDYSKARNCITVTTPESVFANDDFQIAFKLPDWLASKSPTISYTCLAHIIKQASNYATARYIQQNLNSETTGYNDDIVVAAVTSDGMSYWGKSTIRVNPLKLQYATQLPAHWHSSSNGLWLNREEVFDTRPDGNYQQILPDRPRPQGRSVEPASLKAELSMASRNTAGSLDDELAQLKLFKPGDFVGTYDIRPFNIGSYQGYVKEFIEPSLQRSPAVHYSWAGKGFVIKNSLVIDFSYHVTGSGRTYRPISKTEYTPEDDLAFLNPEGQKAINEIHGILLGINLGSADKAQITANVQGEKDKTGKNDKLKPAKAVIKPLPATVKFGQPLKIYLSVPPPGGEDNVVWQSEPGLIFKDPSTVTSTGAAENTVTFNHMGQAKLWAQVKRKIEGEEQNIEAEQVKIEVLPPDFMITVAPQGAHLGEDVEAKISDSPSVQDSLLMFNWESPQDRLPLSKNSRQIRTRLKDNITKFTASASSTAGNEPIKTQITCIYNSVPYKVTARIIEPGVKPMVFDAKLGLVPIKKGTYACDEQVRVEGAIEPQTAGDRPLFSWQSNEGTTISNPISSSPTITRHEPGSAELTLTISNKDGLVLGRTQLSFPVAVVEKQKKAAWKIPDLKNTNTIQDKKVDTEQKIAADTRDSGAAKSNQNSGIAVKKTEPPATATKTWQIPTLNSTKTTGSATAQGQSVASGTSGKEPSTIDIFSPASTTGKTSPATSTKVAITPTITNQSTTSAAKWNIPTLNSNKPQPEANSTTTATPEVPTQTPRVNHTNETNTNTNISTNTNTSTNSPKSSTPTAPVSAPTNNSNTNTVSLPDRINAIIENRDSLPTNIWPKQELVNVYNLVQPGARIQRPGLVTQGGWGEQNGVRFRAARDGRELASRYWSGAPHVSEGGWLRVIWDGLQIIFSPVDSFETTQTKLGTDNVATPSTPSSPITHPIPTEQPRQWLQPGDITGTWKGSLSVLGVYYPNSVTLSMNPDYSWTSVNKQGVTSGWGRWRIAGTTVVMDNSKTNSTITWMVSADKLTLRFSNDPNALTYRR